MNPMLLTAIYVAPATSISEREFAVFIRQYSKRVPLHEIKLCSRLTSEWAENVERTASLPNRYEVPLPTSRHLRKYVPPGKQGLYAMYVRFNPRATFKCFYVGMSEFDTHYRLALHLHKDIAEPYTPGFGQLKQATDIVICHSITQLAESGGNTTRSRLRLLEECMTVLLRPSFLVLAAQ